AARPGMSAVGESRGALVDAARTADVYVQSRWARVLGPHLTEMIAIGLGAAVVRRGDQEGSIIDRASRQRQQRRQDENFRERSALAHVSFHGRARTPFMQFTRALEVGIRPIALLHRNENDSTLTALLPHRQTIARRRALPLIRVKAVLVRIAIVGAGAIGG